MLNFFTGQIGSFACFGCGVGCAASKCANGVGFGGESF